MVLPLLRVVSGRARNRMPVETQAISVLTVRQKLVGYCPDGICAVLFLGANPDFIFQ